MFGLLDESRYRYFTDNRLCFGLKSAPSIFHRISCAITRMMQRRGYKCIVNFLDDILIIEYTYAGARAAQLALIRLLTSLGFAVNWNKVLCLQPRVSPSVDDG